MSAETHSKAPIVFVHGLWLHGESWGSWVKFFRDNGYEATAASWPGDSQTTEETRKNAGAVALTEHQFRFGFTNAVPEQEAKELYARYAMPAPGRPLFQAATATLNPYSATKVNVANANRGPLLLVSGEKDNTVPPVMVKSTLKAYRQSPAVTELKEFPGRGHSLTIDSGWRELAQYSLAWLNAKGL